MQTFKILVKGYVQKKGNKEFASSTVTLIQENDINVLVDTGLDRKKLLQALEKKKLQTWDINYIILTHMHPDHCLLAGLFTESQFLDIDSIYSFNGRIMGHKGKVPGTDIRLLPTPGHCDDHLSVLIQTKKDGRVCIAADLFWWPDDVEQATDTESLLSLEDPYATSLNRLRINRKKILRQADYVVPGHGEGFWVK